MLKNRQQEERESTDSILTELFTDHQDKYYALDFKKDLLHSYGSTTFPHYCSPEMSLRQAVTWVIEKLVHPQDREASHRFFDYSTICRRFAQGEKRMSVDLRHRLPDGKYHWATVTLVPSYDQKDCYLCVLSDLEQQRRNEELEHWNLLLRQQREDDARYRIIVDRTNTLVLEWNISTQSFYASPRLEQFTFWKGLCFERMRSFFGKEDVFAEDWPLVQNLVGKLGRYGLLDGSEVLRFKRVDGSYIWCRLSVSLLCDEEMSLSRVIVTLNDIDELIETQRALAYRSQYDLLTGYSNFESYKCQVAELLNQWDGSVNYSLWYCDLRNFKYLNDINGYEIGDHLLQYWAKIIAEDTRPGEAFARISADNFTAFRRYQNRDELVERFHVGAKRIGEFPEVRESKFPIEIVSGIYCIEESKDILSVEDMIDRANMAQKSVKYLGGNRVAFYNSSMRSRIIQEKSMEGDMNQALENGEFVVYLQAQVNIQNGYEVSGAEALVRWERPSEGLLSPGVFIPLFERNGFIVELDLYVFEQVCHYMEQRRQAGKDLFKIAVNVSRRSILHPFFMKRYLEIKEKYGIPDQLLELECTETVAVDNAKVIAQIGGVARQQGFLFGMDDFGSGYSSLNALKDLPVDVLKLDMDFFREGLISARDRAIVSSILYMARQLDLTVVAEGVEGLDQVEFLRQVGCDIVQGYVFARPVPMEKFSTQRTDQHIHSLMEAYTETDS